MQRCCPSPRVTGLPRAPRTGGAGGVEGQTGPESAHSSGLWDGAGPERPQGSWWGDWELKWGPWYRQCLTRVGGAARSLQAVGGTGHTWVGEAACRRG